MGNFAPLFGEPCKPNPNPPRMELENSSTRSRGEVDSKPVFEDGGECVENSQNKINSIIMKKFLLSIFAVMLAVFSVQAETKTYTYDFSKNTNWVTTKGGSTAVATGSSNKLNAFYDKATGDAFNAGGKGYFNNSGYFLWGASGAYIELPTYAGEKITNVTAESSSGHSTSVTVGIYSGNTSVVSEKTWSTNSSLYSYDIPAEYQSEVLRLQVTNSKNSQVVSITITTETTGEGGGETPENPEGGETIEGGTATYTASDNYNENTSVNDVKLALGDYVTATFSKASGGTAPQYYTSGQSIRWYYGNTLVIESTAGSITGITFGFGSDDSSNAITANVGTYSNGTWTGSANSVTFTVGGTKGNRRISSISVTYAGKSEGEPVVEDVVMPVISPAETDYNVGETIEVEITTTTENATIYYTTDGTDPNTNSLVYSSPIKVSSTTTIKAYAVKDGCNDSPRAEKTFTFRNIVTLNNCTVAELIEAYASGDDIADNATVVGYIVGCVDGTALSKAVFGNEVSTNSNILLADDPYETNIDNCIPVQLPSGNVREALNLVDNYDNYQKKVVLTGNVEAYFSVAALKSTSAYEFVEMFYNTITVSDAGWATLYLAASARIPSDVEAYTVTTVNDGWVSLTQVTGVIPANTGIIVKANAGEYELIVGETATADVTGNLLEGTATATEIIVEAYVLGNVDGVGLYKAKMTDGKWLNNANKAYLPASAVPNKSVAFYGFDWDGTTGIDQITDNREQSTAIYDLTGRRIESITAPGIYIVNGVKKLIR